jgi:hypothetical protein
MLRPRSVRAGAGRVLAAALAASHGRRAARLAARTGAAACVGLER